MKLLNTQNVWWGSTVSSSNLVAAFNECKLGNRQLLSHTLTRAHTHTKRQSKVSLSFLKKIFIGFRLQAQSPLLLVLLLIYYIIFMLLLLHALDGRHGIGQVF